MRQILLIMSSMVLGGTMVVLFAWWFNKINLPIILLILMFGTLIASLISFLLCDIDKWKAKRKKQRITELTLHRFELIGGWPGSTIGQELFRHKTVKSSYKRWLYMIIVIHLTLLISTVWISFS